MLNIALLSMHHTLIHYLLCFQCLFDFNHTLEFLFFCFFFRNDVCYLSFVQCLSQAKCHFNAKSKLTKFGEFLDSFFFSLQKLVWNIIKMGGHSMEYSVWSKLDNKVPPINSYFIQFNLLNMLSIQELNAQQS